MIFPICRIFLYYSATVPQFLIKINQKITFLTAADDFIMVWPNQARSYFSILIFHIFFHFLRICFKIALILFSNFLFLILMLSLLDRIIFKSQYLRYHLEYFLQIYRTSAWFLSVKVLSWCKYFVLKWVMSQINVEMSKR